MHEHKGMISIWFFIGVLLLFYGVVILTEGVYQYLTPPEHPVVLANLHAGIWWGHPAAHSRRLVHFSLRSKDQ